MSLLIDIEKHLGSFHLRVQMETSGGITCLLGASGCGKSMTLKCVAGIERPDRGQIILDGVTLFDSARRINLPPQQRHVGYLFQHYALFPTMTVEKNILCGLKNEKDRRQRETALAEAARLLQLEDLLRHKPHQLSGGQAQRVALARILVNRPRLLLLDEPFSALDTHLRDKLQIELKELLQGYGHDALIVTHSRDEAYRLGDHLAVMAEGELLGLKPTREFFANPETRAAAVLTGCKNIVACRRVGPRLVEVPAWGMTLETALPVREDVSAIGIRAHYFSPETAQNRAPVRFVGELEEPFERILRFRWENQDANSPDVWWRVPKQGMSGAYPEQLGVRPADVLPLYEKH